MAVMAKERKTAGKASELPQLETPVTIKVEEPQTPEPEQIDVAENESTTVAGVQWVTIRVPVVVGGNTTSGHMPERIDTGRQLLKRSQRIAAKSIMRAFANEDVRLADGTHATRQNHIAFFLLDQVYDALEQKD